MEPGLCKQQIIIIIKIKQNKTNNKQNKNLFGLWMQGVSVNLAKLNKFYKDKSVHLNY